MEMEKRRGVQDLILITDTPGLSAFGITNNINQDDSTQTNQVEEVGLLAATQHGLEVWRYSTGERVSTIEWGLPANLVSIDYSSSLGVIVTGHTDGTIAIRRITDLGRIACLKRNEASIYSVKFDGDDLLVGTASGLPARLRVEVDSIGLEQDDGKVDTEVVEKTTNDQQLGKQDAESSQAPGIRLVVREEYAGWEAVGVECWTVGKDGVWCAGGEGGVRRY